MKDQPKSASKKPSDHTREKPWWFCRRGYQTVIVQGDHAPVRPPGVTEREITIAGPFVTRDRAERHRSRVTSRTFDADDKGEVFK